MAYKSTEDYLNEWIKNNKAQKDAAIAGVNAIKQSSINAINEQANKNIAEYEKGFTEGVMETEAAAEDVREKNAINRALNERYINERMANLGLAGSGYENAIRAGNEAYFKNTNEIVSADNQKAIDTLAATLKQNKENTDLWRTEEKSKVESNARQDIYDIEQKFAMDAEKYAENMVEADKDAFEQAQKISENYLKKVEVDGEEKDYWTPGQKNYYVQSYADKYGLDRALSELPANIAFTELTKGWDISDWKSYFNSIKKKKGKKKMRDEMQLTLRYAPAEYRKEIYEELVGW